MNRFKISLFAASLLTGLAFSACDSRPDIAGTWTGTPSRIDGITAAAEANATMSLSFSNADRQNKNGDIFISAIISATQPVSPEHQSVDIPYEVSVTSTAVISGHWSFEPGDDDDILITLDPSTLKVDVDPDGVTFSSDILTGVQQPTVDSLSVATAAAWKKSINHAMQQKFYDFQKISDIKVHNGIMSCEIHDRDFTFRKTE